MMMRLDVMCFMDGVRSVDDFRLHSLLVDDGDNGFVDMVVNVLSGDGWLCFSGVLGLMCLR